VLCPNAMASVDVLRASGLFRGFTETGIQILAGIATERSFTTGAPLFVEGSAADSLVLIAEGQVRLSARSHSGEAVLLGKVGPGHSLGALSLMNQGRRMCSAVAASRVSVVEIRQGDFQRLLSKKPQACLKLLMNIVGELGQRLQDNRESLRSLIEKT
jgi:CRP/FNR family transcriptional regulator, cyclic AMP receptor protein